jgi:hypothetical protein
MESRMYRGGVSTGEITIAELVRNGTMSAAMAATLWAAAEEQVSFLVAAVPRNAGKSTTSNAVLALRRPGVPINNVAGRIDEMERFKREKVGGYLQVNEFSRGGMPGYIWGEPVRRVFDALPAGYSLQATLHAPSVDVAIDQVTRGNGVSDEDASRIKLVVYIEMFGRTWDDAKRRVAEVYEIHAVQGGKPIGHPLHRWLPNDDTFEKLMDPHQWGRDAADFARKEALITELAASGRTDASAVSEAIAAYRS